MIFKLNESIPAHLRETHHVEVLSKLVNLDSHTVELVTARNAEHAVTWGDTVVAISGDIEVTEMAFNHYCLKAMALYPHSSFRIIDFRQ